MHRTRIGPFALEQQLDESPQGNVLRGVHVERQVAMAIKLLPPTVVTRTMGGDAFQQDVKRLQKLTHPNIVRVYGGAVEDGQPYLALELVEGESLAARLDRLGKIPWEMAVEVAEAICDALQAAHGQRIAHRRLTTRRVLISSDGQIKITGFDCVWADHDEVMGLRCPVEVAHFLSPEQFRGKQSANLPACDLYSMGVILYRCLTGEYPWPAGRVEEIILARRAGPAPRVSEKVLDCPVWLDLFVARLLGKKRADRYATADQVHQALASAKHKLSKGVGAAQQAFSGQKGALTVDYDRSEVRRLKRSGPVKQVTKSPFYEQAWFLALALLLLIAGGVWSLLPPGEETLFSRAKPLMQSDSPADWRRAQDQYLTPLLERFPDTEHAAEIQEFEARFARHRAMMSVKNVYRTGREPRSEAERRFCEAWRHQQDGHLITAWRKYEAFVRLFDSSPDPEARPYVELARIEIEKIRNDPGDQGDLATFVASQIDRAQQLADSGQLLEARKLLDSVLMLYGQEGEFTPLIDRAQQLLRQIDNGGAGNDE